MRGQIALAHAGAFGLLQDFTYFLDGKELGNHAEADVIGDPAAGRQACQWARRLGCASALLRAMVMPGWRHRNGIGPPAHLKATPGSGKTEILLE